MSVMTGEEGRMSNKEIREIRVVSEYLKRMKKLMETHQGSSTDEDIDCPECGRQRAIVFNNDGSQRWKCLTAGCAFKFRENLEPPSPNEYREMYNLWKRLECFKKLHVKLHVWLNFLDS